MEPLHRHRIFSTTDLGEGEQFASQIWERNRSTMTSGRYGLRWNQLEGKKLSFSYVEHDCAVELKAQGPLSDQFRILFHSGGSIEHTVRGRSFVSSRDSVVTHSPGIDLRLDIQPFKLLMLSIDGDFVRTAMAQRFRKVQPFQNWLGSLRPSPKLHSLRSFASWLAAEMDRSESPLAEPGKPRMQAERLLQSLFVECLADEAPDGGEVVQDVSLAQVRRAEEWINANLTETFGVEEVATATGIGVRSLQQGFKRFHACSPHEFITRRRLELARQMLANGTPDDTVTDIATKLGFFELGRFSQRYRQHFGETPSMTLGRRHDVR